MSLQPFDGAEVTECAVRIVRAGDGLSEALDAAPVELHHNATVYVLLRCAVTKVTHEQVKDSPELRRVHTLAATFGTIVPEAAARKTLDQARRNIEQHAGVQRIPGTDTSGDE